MLYVGALLHFYVVKFVKDVLWRVVLLCLTSVIWICTNVGTKIMTAIFFLRNFDIVRKFRHCGYILYKVELSFTQSFLHYQHTYRTFVWGICQLHFAEAWNVWHTHSVSACHSPQNGTISMCPLGGQKDGSWRVLSQDWREDEGEKTWGADVGLSHVWRLMGQLVIVHKTALSVCVL